VREAVRAAFRAGADGVILSRKYSEMRLANLRAAGDGLPEGLYLEPLPLGPFREGRVSKDE